MKIIVRILKIIASFFFFLGIIPISLIAILVYIYNGSGKQVMEWYDKLEPI